ncbi:hypothetical protein EU523_00470 [Candidatus Heimdallarchaeota archaeon]|nr:MAG: hypothetical protein EU523_00470 [Candidatus Heimdallarchaeota archaeon]
MTLFSGAIVSSTGGTSDENLAYTMLSGVGYYNENMTQSATQFFVVVHAQTGSGSFLLDINFGPGDTIGTAIDISNGETKNVTLDVTADIVFFKFNANPTDTYHFDLKNVGGMTTQSTNNFDLFLINGQVGSDDYEKILYYAAGEGIDKSFAYHCPIGQYYLVIVSNKGSGDCELTISTNQSPTIEITSHENDDYVSSTTEITWLATDPENDSLSIDLEISEDQSTWTPILEGTLLESYLWNTTTNDDGTYYLKVTVTDGGDTYWDQVRIIVDNTIPEIVLESPTAGSNVTVGQVITIEITDDNEIVTTYYSWNDGANETELSTVPDTTGLITLDVYVCDVAGNWAHEQFSWTIVEETSTPTTSTNFFTDITSKWWFWVAIGAVGLVVLVIVVVVIVRSRKKPIT